MKDKENNRIDEGRRIDDLFRQGLENLNPEPSTDLWKGINQKLWWDEISHFTFTNLSKLLLIGGIAGVMTLITALMVVVVPQAKSSDEDPFSILSEPTSNHTNLVIPVSSVSNLTHEILIQRTPEEQNKKANQSENINSTQVLTSENANQELLTDRYTSPEPAYSSNTSVSSQIKIDQETNQGFILYMEPINHENLLVLIPADPQTAIAPTTIQNIVKGNPPIPRFFSIDMGVTPEVTFNGNSSSNSEMNFSGDIGINYHFGKFSIRSGIGISYVADDGIYRIDYKSNDSVGFYNMVVSFAINQQDPSQIVYVTQRMVVYDSLQHIADDQTRNRYTYLQVPFFAGFRILETNRLALTIHAGPMVSFLIGKKEAQPVIDYPNARIIRIDNNTPVRVTTSWQLWLGLRLDYKINKAFSLFAEPNYKYYFKPVTEQKEGPVKNPYSIGVGIGIQYNIGPKIHKP
jgi:hypothetical protein